MTTTTRNRSIDFSLSDYDPIEGKSVRVDVQATRVNVHVDGRNAEIRARYITMDGGAIPSFISVGVGTYNPDRGDGYPEFKDAAIFLSVEQAEQMIAELRAAVAVAKNEA